MLDNSEHDNVSCVCKTRSVCQLNQFSDELCQCKDFCKKYLPQYNSLVERLTKVCFFTFNPKPKTQAQHEFLEGLIPSDLKIFQKWVKANFTDDDNIESFIAVSELTKKAQIHYHVLVKFKDKVKFKKRVVQRLYYDGNIDAQYKPPRFGLHYLFKQQEDMMQYHEAKRKEVIITK